GYRDDICGGVSDGSGNTMLVFDYDGTASSSVGLNAASCRTDALWGSELPYDQATLASLRGAPGALGCGSFASLRPPYAPSQSPFPDATDVAAPIMSFPVAASPVAIGVDLQAVDCGGTKPSNLQFTTSMISRLLGGDIKTWNDPDLRAGGVNGSLA